MTLIGHSVCSAFTSKKLKIICMKKLLFTVLVVLPFFFVSCKKNLEDSTTVPTSTVGLDVPQNFKWETITDIQLTIKGQSDGMVEVQSPDGKTYWKVFIVANQSSTFVFSVPSYETSLKLKYQGQTVDLKIKSSTLSYEFQ